MGPADFKNVKNNESEQDVPIWRINPYHLDPIFDDIRFERHLIDYEADLHFKRRTTWLKPLDGCYMRAEVFSKRIVKRLKQIFPWDTFFLPKKHFVFGKLVAKNNNTLDGFVTWTYHVVP